MRLAEMTHQTEAISEIPFDFNLLQFGKFSKKYFFKKLNFQVTWTLENINCLGVQPVGKIGVCPFLKTAPG
jgi:hypothetical protein